MTGKKLTKNLVQYLTPHFNIPVYIFDGSPIRSIPCIVVGYDSEDGELSFLGNYDVKGSVKVLYQGYDDPDNTQADITTASVLSCLYSPSLLTSLNKPLSGTDTRSLTGLGVYQFGVSSVTRDEEDESVIVNIQFESPTVNCDF